MIFRWSASSTSFGKLTLRDNPDFLDGAEVAETTLALHGLDRFAARKRIVALMEEKGLLNKAEPHLYQVPHGDRSGVVIEPWLTEQWYVDAKTLAEPAIAAVETGRDGVRARRAGRRPTSNGCATSSRGAFRASCGGDTRYRRGTGRTARSSSPRPRARLAQRPLRTMERPSR